MPDKQEKGTVEFDHVSFAYPEAGENVINDITFKAEKGQTVAIIGSTGSGKSTLVNLIPRFYDATNIAQKELNGTARFVGMGGAMGCLLYTSSVVKVVIYTLCHQCPWEAQGKKR